MRLSHYKITSNNQLIFLIDNFMIMSDHFKLHFKVIINYFIKTVNNHF